MKLSEIKYIKNTLEISDWREVVGDINNGEDDFTFEEVRFIKASAIQETLKNELESDTYILGCFKADFISDITERPKFLIEAAQESESYEEIGQALIDFNLISDMAGEYARFVGYGHHFNSLDGEEEEKEIDGIDYYIFKCKA